MVYYTLCTRIHWMVGSMIHHRRRQLIIAFAVVVADDRLGGVTFEKLEIRAQGPHAGMPLLMVRCLLQDFTAILQLAPVCFERENSFLQSLQLATQSVTATMALHTGRNWVDLRGADTTDQKENSSEQVRKAAIRLWQEPIRPYAQSAFDRTSS
ncbi:uncharacterized protein MYCFIDRAFT_169078 [Pseudocercospora fijiensis CIRAD86]|uniref:Uncharacterized protein n=1 Tax=Pseudocercospora fijiensis (strain CIRAD86) TaxID=383855 RepID=N1Q8F7_PSEFD|nr:uncharacterized protein MYCFIDRAFT_169078 [Pseudocercospora fijiensis CIRAD86]EME87222.1 hypothetical protein MYCFIDRAFT_169078 [Pseudocercospora fijiensis CIRAD86]